MVSCDEPIGPSTPRRRRFAEGRQPVNRTDRADARCGSSSANNELRRSQSSIFDELRASAASPGPLTRSQRRNNAGVRKVIPRENPTENRPSAVKTRFSRATRNYSPSTDEELRSLATSSDSRNEIQSSIFDELRASAASPGPLPQANTRKEMKNSRLKSQMTGIIAEKKRSDVPKAQMTGCSAENKCSHAPNLKFSRGRSSSIDEELRSLTASIGSKREMQSSIFDELHSSAASPAPAPAPAPAPPPCGAEATPTPKFSRDCSSSIDEELRSLAASIGTENTNQTRAPDVEALQCTSPGPERANSQADVTRQVVETPNRVDTKHIVLSQRSTGHIPQSTQSTPSQTFRQDAMRPGSLQLSQSTKRKPASAHGTPDDDVALQKSALRVPGGAQHTQPKKRTSFSDRVEVMNSSGAADVRQLNDTSKQGTQNKQHVQQLPSVLCSFTLRIRVGYFVSASYRPKRVITPVATLLRHSVYLLRLLPEDLYESSTGVHLIHH